MASNVTLLSMRTQARERSDQVNSKFVSDSELNGFLNASIKKLYNKLVLAGEIYYKTTEPLTLVSGQREYDLPATFFKLLGIDFVMDAQGNATPLKSFEWQERGKYLYGIPAVLPYLRYCLVGQKVEFLPVPQGGAVVNVHFAPIFANLTADADTFDGINGWEEYPIIDAARKMLAKEESDTTELNTELAIYDKQLDEMKIMRDVGSPGRIADVSRNDPEQIYPYPYTYTP